MGRNKSIGPDGVPREILILGGEVLNPYLARLLDITIKNATIPSDWKTAMVVPIYKEGDRSVVTNYRPVSLISVVCKQIEHDIARYLRQVWNTNKWQYKDQHGFTPGYSCDRHIVIVCQDIADFLGEGARIDAIIIDFSKAFDFVPCDRLLTQTEALGVDSRAVTWVWEFLLRHYVIGKSE